jgi:hypothetical protein
MKKNLIDKDALPGNNKMRCVDAKVEREINTKIRLR